MRLFQFDHVALYVSDLSKSETFYGKVLGLRPIPNPFTEGKAWFQIDEKVQLHLIQNDDGKLLIPERSHICFSVSDLEHFITALAENKILFSDFENNINQIRIRPDGIKQIYFQDPDGYWIEINDSIL